MHLLHVIVKMMKRLVFILAMLCVGHGIAMAQEFTEQRIAVSVGAGVFTSVFAHDGTLSKGSLLEEGSNVLQIDAGGVYALTQSFGLGLDVGYRFYAGKMKVGAVDEGYYRQFRQQSVPLFLTADLSNPQWRLSPYLKAKAGYSIPARHNGADAHLVYKGFTAEGNAGLQFRSSRIDCQIGLAVLLDTLHNDLTGGSELAPLLGLRLGITIH